jgi:GntR family transcriptional regulator
MPLARASVVPSSRPLYRQIASAITDEIGSGALRPGDRLPSEEQLSVWHGVARMTVRQALQELAAAGLVVRRHGLGTFVANPKIVRRVTGMSGFFDDLVARGIRPTSQVLEARTVPAGHALAERLGIPDDLPVVYLVRLRLADADPASLSSAYLDAALCAPVLRADLVNRSLYAILEQDCHLVLGYAEQRVEARGASREAARWLRVRTGSPLLYVERVTSLVDHRFLGLTETLYRSDRYALTSMVYR